MKIPARAYQLILHILDKLAWDEAYISVLFYQRLGYWPNIRHPKTFNEKLQWLKLYDRNPKYSEYADKYAVRKHIIETIGESYLIPIIGVYDSVDEIEFETLPEQFVLKCNHGAGCNIICKDKSKLDIEDAKYKLNKWMHTDYSRLKRELHYANDLFDYKFFCFGGIIQMIQVDFGRYNNHTRNIYDAEWNLLNVEIVFPRNPNMMLTPPSQLGEMKKLARILSKEFKQVRVDFYVINSKVYFGELTFFSGAGFSRYKPKSFEIELGKKIIIPELKYKK